jgi:hypothetical protein
VSALNVLGGDFAAKSPRLTLDTIRQNGSRRRRVPGTEGGYGAVTRANRRMIFASSGSLTALVACPGDGAFVLLRHSWLCCRTSSAITCTRTRRCRRSGGAFHMKRIQADPDRRRRLLHTLRGPLIDGAFGPYAASLLE